MSAWDDIAARLEAAGLGVKPGRDLLGTGRVKHLALRKAEIVEILLADKHPSRRSEP